MTLSSPPGTSASIIRCATLPARADTAAALSRGETRGYFFHSGSLVETDHDAAAVVIRRRLQRLRSCAERQASEGEQARLQGTGEERLLKMLLNPSLPTRRW